MEKKSNEYLIVKVIFDEYRIFTNFNNVQKHIWK